MKYRFVGFGGEDKLEPLWPCWFVCYLYHTLPNQQDYGGFLVRNFVAVIRTHFRTPEPHLASPSEGEEKGVLMNLSKILLPQGGGGNETKFFDVVSCYHYVTLCRH